MYRKSLTFATLLFSAFNGSSQIVTNVSDKVNNILIAHGKVNVTRVVTTKIWEQREKVGEHGGGGGGYWVSKILPVTIKEYLQPIQIRTLKVSNIEFSQDSIISLPERFIETSQDFINTSSINSTQSETFSLSFTRGNSISFAHSIAHTTSYNSSFQLKITDALSLGGNIQIGESETQGTIFVSNNQITVTRSSTVQVNLSPRVAVHASFRVWTVRHLIKFKCFVTIDANISSNDSGITLLSQIAEEQNRSFEIDGVIIVDDCTAGQTYQSDPVKLTKQQIRNITIGSAANSLQFE